MQILRDFFMPFFIPAVFFPTCLTSDYDEKNAFDIERFLSTELRLKPDDAFTVYEADLSEN